MDFFQIMKLLILNTMGKFLNEEFHRNLYLDFQWPMKKSYSFYKKKIVKGLIEVIERDGFNQNLGIELFRLPSREIK